jgi:multicomponent Na+:H+ antiporter subunit D
VWRVSGRVFAGLGSDKPPPDPSTREHEGVETVTEHDHTPVTMLAPALVLVVAGLVIGLVPGFVHEIEHAAARFADRGAYAGTVLGGSHPHAPRVPLSHLHSSDFIYASLSLLLALLLAWTALLPRGFSVLARAPVVQIRRLHSGHVGDYVAWFTFGLATLGGLFALTLR